MSKPWSKEEDILLKELHKNKSLLGNNFPNRTQRAIEIRASRLGLNTKPDIEYERFLETTDYTLIDKYTGSDKKLLHRHTICNNTWYIRPNHIKSGKGCPYCSIRRRYSKIAIQWLTSLNDLNILHAENGGEQTVLGFKVDGYNPITNTVYEFHGDVYHGNLDLYNEQDKCHPFDKEITAGELWDITFNRMLKLSHVSSVVYIWERDYKNGKTFGRF